MQKEKSFIFRFSNQKPSIVQKRAFAEEWKLKS